MSNLEINTPKGQETLIDEKKVIEEIKKKWGVHIIETDKKRESRIDNLIIQNDVLKAIAEVKCRDMTLLNMEEWGDTWLITNQKLIDGAILSKLLSVPFFGFLYLIPENLILYWKITNDKGEFLFPFDVVNSRTRYSCNGGSIVRENAYLPRKYSKQLKEIKWKS
jgi:hypothetical protein